VNFGTHMTTMPVMMGIHEKFLLCSWTGAADSHASQTPEVHSGV